MFYAAKVAHVGRRAVLAHGLGPPRRRDAGRPAPPSAQTIADEIADPRRADPFLAGVEHRHAKASGISPPRSVTQYPRSLAVARGLRDRGAGQPEGGDGAGALDWGERALRLLPENVPLLVMVADIAAKQREPELAERSARAAIRLLETAGGAPTATTEQWTQMRGGIPRHLTCRPRTGGRRTGRPCRCRTVHC